MNHTMQGEWRSDGNTQGWGAQRKQRGQPGGRNSKGKDWGSGGRAGQVWGAVSSWAQLQGRECWNQRRGVGGGGQWGQTEGTGSCLLGLGIRRVSRGQWEPWWVRSRARWASFVLWEDHSGCGGMGGRIQGGEETIAQVCWWFEVRQSLCGWGGRMD